jgi:hypothetical protein
MNLAEIVTAERETTELALAALIEAEGELRERLAILREMEELAGKLVVTSHSNGDRAERSAASTTPERVETPGPAPITAAAPRSATETAERSAGPSDQVAKPEARSGTRNTDWEKLGRAGQDKAMLDLVAVRQGQPGTFYGEQLGVGQATSSKVLNRLLADGKVRREGVSRRTRWFLDAAHDVRREAVEDGRTLTERVLGPQAPSDRAAELERATAAAGGLTTDVTRQAPKLDGRVLEHVAARGLSSVKDIGLFLHAPPAEVQDALHRLRVAGDVRQRPDGRWESLI